VTTELDRGAVRGVRAGILASAAVLGAVSAHSLVDGCVNVVGALLALGYAWPAAVAVLGARRRVPALLLWLTGVQVVTHVLLDWTCTSVSSGQVGFAEHLVSGLQLSPLLVHGASVALSAAVLGRADAGLWLARGLVTAARSFLRPVLPGAFVPDRTRALPVLQVELAADVWQVPHPVRRGPPALLPA
jgi:hypothetical protein